MAQDQYRQHPQQAGPAKYNFYAQESSSREWNNGGQGGAVHDQGNRSYPPVQSPRNNYGDYGDYGPPRDPRYNQGARFEGQRRENSYQRGMGDYHGPDQYQQGPRNGRPYEYDERFHEQDYPRQRPSNGAHRPSNGGQRPSHSNRPPPLNFEKRPKPKERILTEPVSPKEISWDNPFPTFNMKKKEHKKNHSSLDKGLSKLNIADVRPGDPRPNTSQSHRKQTDSRPQTSHGAHGPDPRPPMNAPPFSPVSPLRKAPPFGREFDRPGQRRDPAFAPQNRPGPSVFQNHIPKESSDSFHSNGGHGEMNHPPRTMIPPGNRDERSLRRAMTDPSSQQPFSNPDPLPSLPGSYPEQYEESYNDHYEEYPPLQKARTQESVRRDEMSYESQNIRPRQDLGHHGQPHGVTSLPPTEQPHYNDEQLEMPDFDAIPFTSNEKPDVHLQSGQEPFRDGSYQKNVYAGRPAPNLALDTRGISSHQARVNENRTPIAEFAFGLPPNGPHSAPSPIQSSTQPYMVPRENGETYDSPNQQSFRDERSEQQREVKPAGQFPPRNASRVDGVSRPGPEPNRYPAPNNPGYQRRPTDEFANQRPKTAQGSGNRGPRPGPGPHSNLYGQNNEHGYSDPQLSHRQEPPNPRNDSYEQNSKVGYALTSQTSYGSDQGQRPKTGNSAHPAPVRYYGERSSLDGPRAHPSPQYGTQANASASPALPAPVRPGLSNQPTSSQSMTRVESRPPVNGAGQQYKSSSGQEVATRSTNGQNGTKQPPSPVTTQELQALDQAYRSRPGDNELGLKYAKKLVEAASVLASEGGKADAKTTAKNRERYILEAQKIVKRLVGANYGDAMFYLADCYGQGLLGLAPDPKEAFLLYQSAAKNGHAQAAYRVAVCCEMGQEEGGGTRRDPLKAIQWYKRAASLGDTPAMYKMGMILLKGLLGQPKNPREAISWLKRAAERADAENPHALHELGLLYESASSTDQVVRDERYALQLFNQASDLGYKYSQFRLGSAYEYGLLGCPVDARQSISWYSRAAAQGEHQAELALSGWYLTGSEGILQQSDTEAYLWAWKAASSQSAKAEYAMGYFTEVGIGTTANMEEAKKWYYRAAAQSFPKARERLEDLKRGGQKMQKTRVSRSAVSKQNEGDCVIM